MRREVGWVITAVAALAPMAAEEIARVVLALPGPARHRTAAWA
jgi:hypothetical protein